MDEAAGLLQKRLEVSRREVHRLGEPLCALTEPERSSFQVKGVPLGLRPDEFELLCEVAFGNSPPSPVAEEVVDSVALALLWGDLLEEWERHPKAPGQRALLLGFLGLLRERIDSSAAGSHSIETREERTTPDSSTALAGSQDRLQKLHDDVHRVLKSVPLEDFLGNALKELARIAKANAGDCLPSIGIRTLGTTVRALTEREWAALLRQGQAPLSTLLSLTAAATYQAGRDFGWLVLPEGAQPPESTASDADRVADLDCIELVSRLLGRIVRFAEIRPDREVLEVVLPIHRRLDELVPAARNALGEAREKFRKRAFLPPFAVEDFRKAAPAAPPTEATAVRAGPRAPRTGLASLLAGPRVVAGCFLLMLLAGAVVDSVFAFRELGKAASPRPFRVEEIAAYIPAARILSVTEEERKKGLIRIQVGHGWRELPQADQADRLFSTCQFLAAHAYESAQFLYSESWGFAQWVGGRITLTEDVGSVSAGDSVDRKFR